jgi:hypothetical protein
VIEQLKQYVWRHDGQIWARRAILKGSIPDDFTRNYSMSGMVSEIKMNAARQCAMYIFEHSPQYDLLKDYVDENTQANVFYDAATMDLKFTISMIIPDDVYAHYLFMKG